MEISPHREWEAWRDRRYRISYRLTTGHGPISQHPYRAGPRTVQIEHEYVEFMLKKWLIEPTQSAWASPLVFAQKSDYSLRFYVDYRKLKAVPVRYMYLLPRIYEFIDILGVAAVFATQDANWGYWEMPIGEKDCNKPHSYTMPFYYGLPACLSGSLTPW